QCLQKVHVPADAFAGGVCECGLPHAWFAAFDLDGHKLPPLCAQRAICAADQATLPITIRCTLISSSTSCRGISSAAAIRSGASPARCMRNAWERLLRFNPGLGSALWTVSRDCC